MTKAIYPGSFDPVTYGHLDIAKRAASIFDEVIIAVMINPKKTGMFSLEERVTLIEENCKDTSNIRVVSFEGLLTNYMKTQGIKAIIKGLRTTTDYEYEFQMALLNKRLFEQAETFLLPTSEKYSLVSSSMVKEMASFGGPICEYVPPNVEQAIHKKI